MKNRLLALLAIVGLPFVAMPAEAAVGECSPPGPGTSCTGNIIVNGSTTDVGDTGLGSLVIIGGNTYSPVTLDVGVTTSANGSSVTIDPSATLDDDAIIGDAGTATMTNNGIQSVAGNLILGNQSTGNGTYTITGTNAQTNVNFAGTAGGSPPETPNGALIVGNAGTGNFTQETFMGTDATPVVTVAGDLALGLQSGSTGTYTLNDGALTVGGAMIVGEASTNNNLFTQNGGSVNLTGSANGNSLYAPVSGSESPGALYVGGVTDSGVGTYTMTAGTLSAPSGIVLGLSGVGTLNQSGGQVTTGFVDMGNCGGCAGGNAAGYYNLSGSGTLTTGGINDGDFGHAEFVQGADGLGTTENTVNGTLAIGNAATSTPNDVIPNRSGTYTLDSGTLSTQNTLVGNLGVGTLVQNGGANNVASYIDVGVQNTALSGPVGTGTPSNPIFGGPAQGNYTMTGGTLSIGGDASQNNFASSYPGITGGTGLIVGDAGNGVFNQFGPSTVTSGTPQVPNTSAGVEGDLVIGAQGPATAGGTGTSQGTYNLGQTGQGAAPSLTVNGSVIIGRDAGSNGATIPGASPTNPNLVIQGVGTNLSAFYNGGGQGPNANPLSGDIMVGLNGNGAVTQTDNSTVYMDGDLSIGINQGAVGSYNLNATSNGGNLQVGNFLNIGGVGEFVNSSDEQTAAIGGTGYFTQSSGDVTVVSDINIGNNGGTGTYTQSGGTVTATGLVVGNGGTGTYNLSGTGLLTASQSVVGAFGGSVGTFNQTGGTFDANFLNVGIFPGGVGTYAMSLGNLNIAGNLGLGGPNAQGTFTQSNGVVQAGGLFDNNDNEGTLGGSYSISGGSLTVGGVSYIGNGAADGNTAAGNGGLFTQTGGQVTFSSALNIGIGANICAATSSPCTASGAYTTSGGTATIDALNVGGGSAGSTGTFTMNPNAGDAFPGIIPTSQDPLVNANSLTIAIGGTVQINSGLMTVGATGTLGNNGSLNVGAAGTASISGDSTAILNVANNMTVGAGGSGTAFFTQSGGAVTIGTAGTNANNSPSIGNLYLGSNFLLNGTYNMSGGTLTVNSNASFFNAAMEIGQSAIGTFNQTNGSVVTNGANGFAIGDCGGCGGSGAYNISGGSLTVNANSNVSGQSGNGFVGAHENGTMTQSGDATVSIAANLFVGYDNPNSTNGLYTLGGNGVLNIGTGNNGGAGGDPGDLNIGTLSDGHGSFFYNLTSGDAATLSFAGTGQNLVVGDSGTGLFLEGSNSNPTDLNLQTSGTTLDIARGGNSVGLFILAKGSSLEDDMIVGDAGVGEFDNNGGSNTVGTASVPANLILGNQSTGYGTYDNNGGSNTINGELIVGAGGTGIYNLGNGVTGATLNVVGTGLQGDIFAGENGTGTITAGNGAIANVGSSIILGGSSPGESGTGTFNLTEGSTLSVSSATIVGGFGTGIFLNDASTHSTEILVLGAETGSNGTYTLQDSGVLNVGVTGNPGFFDVAENGTGTFSQTSGTTTIIGDLDIGRCGAVASATCNNDDSQPPYTNPYTGTTGNGTVTLSGGSMSVSTFAVVGDAGTGTVNQSGGSSFSANSLELGRDGGTGSYTLDGSTSTVNITSFLRVGDNGSGNLFTQNNGSVTVGGGLTIGVFAAGTDIGGYNVPAGSGEYDLNGGTLTVTGGLDLGASAGTSGTFNFNTAAGDAAKLVFNGTGQTLTVGDAGNGTFNQGGGDLNLAGEGVTLNIGLQAGSNGAYNLTGGTLEDTLIVGNAGTGTFTNTGGTHTVSGDLIVGNQSTGNGTYTLGGTGNLTLATSGAQIILGNAAGANGTFDFNTAALDAGTITFNSGTSQQILVGNSGNGVFTQGGGNLNLSTPGVGLDIAVNANSFGQFNLQGGTLETLSLNVGDAGSGQFNQSGGTATINGNLVAGNQTGSAGNISIYGTANLTVTGDFTIGNNGFGNYRQDDSGTVVDVKGSMTVASNGAIIDGGSLTVGDGGTGKELLVVSGSSLNISDTGTQGALVTVDGNLINNGELELGNHDVTPSATLTVNGGTLQNNNFFNFEANSIVNANVSNGSLTNDTAEITAQNGATTNVTLNGNMDNYAIVNVAAGGGGASTFTQNGTFNNHASGTFTVNDGAVTINGGSGDSLDNTGTVTFENNSNSPFAPSVVALKGNVTNSGPGIVNVQGSTVTITGNGNSNPALDNSATLNIGTGSNGQGSTFTVTGNTTNEMSGVVNVTDSTVHWNGTFTNNGAYHSDPSTSYFTNLDVGATGYLTGSSGDIFDVSGNFDNESTQKTLWSTAAAELEFSTGTSTSHDLNLAGLDEGPIAAGFDDNFAWYLLDIDAGNSLDLLAGSGDALYVSTLEGLDISGDDVTNIFGDGFNIYYDPTVDTALDSQTYALEDGGLLCAIGTTCTNSSPPPPPVPEPSSLVLLGSGLIGFLLWRRKAQRASNDNDKQAAA